MTYSLRIACRSTQAGYLRTACRTRHSVVASPDIRGTSILVVGWNSKPWTSRNVSVDCSSGSRHFSIRSEHRCTRSGKQASGRTTDGTAPRSTTVTRTRGPLRGEGELQSGDFVILRDEGCRAEVYAGGELTTALAAGSAPAELLLTGMNRGAADVERALELLRIRTPSLNPRCSWSGRTMTSIDRFTESRTRGI